MDGSRTICPGATTCALPCLLEAEAPEPGAPPDTAKVMTPASSSMKSPGVKGQEVGETQAAGVAQEGHQVRLTWEARGLVCSVAGSSLLRPSGSEPPTPCGTSGSLGPRCCLTLGRCLL